MDGWTVTDCIVTCLRLQIERWIAVCRPLQLRTGFTVERARMLICVIIIVAALFCLPRFFENECTTVRGLIIGKRNGTYSSYSFVTESANISSLTNDTRRATRLQCVTSEIAKTAIYRYGYGVIMYAIFVFLLPVGSVLFLNGHIIFELRRWDAAINELSTSQKIERRISNLPLGVAIMFCVLETPALAINVVDFAVATKQNHIWDVVLAINQMLVLTDSAANFFVYLRSMKWSYRSIVNIFRTNSHKHSDTRLVSDAACTSCRNSSNVQLQLLTVRNCHHRQPSSLIGSNRNSWVSVTSDVCSNTTCNHEYL
jgi:hypothetical protein